MNFDYNFDENFISYRKGNVKLTNREIEVLDRYKIDYKNCKNLKELLFEIEEIINDMDIVDEDLDYISCTISERPGGLQVSCRKCFQRFLRFSLFFLPQKGKSRKKIQNPKIDQVLYAMRSIDIGISLCDFTEIERGINNLKSFFSEVQ